MLSTRVASKRAAATVARVSRFRWQLPSDPPVEGREPFLPAGRATLAAHVLEENQLPVGLQHPARLRQHCGRIRDRAKHERGHDDVERLVGIGEASADPATTSTGTRAAATFSGSRFAMLGSGSSATTREARS